MRKIGPKQLICIGLSWSFYAFAQMPSGVLKKQGNSQGSEEAWVPKPIFYFDPNDEKKPPELIVRVPIKFKAKAQPLMIGKSAESPTASPSPAP